MHILHINLAKGFRGGERQTGLLIDGLAAAYPQLRQSLIIRYDSPLPNFLKNTHAIKIIKVKKPYVCYLLGIKKDIDIIHAHEAKACHFAYLLSKRINTPYIMTRRMDRAPKTDWFTRKVYKHSSYVVSLSSAINTIIHDYYIGLKTSIIPSMRAGLAFNKNSIEVIRKQYPKKILIGHIGALVKKHKGQHYIIEAARKIEKKHPDIHFLLIGEGKDKEDLIRHAHGLTNVEFIGFKSAIGNYLRTFDIFLFPSLEEGLGSTLLDAMEAALPIIASNVGGIPDIIRHKENGLLIPSHDATAIIDAILLLLKDKTLAETLGKQGYTESAQYSPTAISRRYMDIYKTITHADNAT